MIPVIRIQEIKSYGHIVVEMDDTAFNDLIDSALRRAYGNGYEDGAIDSQVNDDE